MKTVSLTPLNRSTAINTNERVLDVLLAEQLNVMTFCKGRGLCATCHVYVEEGADSLTPPTQREQRTLGRLSQCKPNSRLACQARVRGEGIQIRVPEGMYIDQVSDLYSLMGKRADIDIRHPITGDLLVPKGKIILRAFLDQLKDVEVELSNFKASDA